MNSVVIISLWILLLFNKVLCQDETVSVLRSEKVELTCLIDIATCGELHSLKWFKGTDRIAVVSGDGEVAKVEGSYNDRLYLDHEAQRSRLIFKNVEISDEDTYLCETTFLEPSELCENSGAYSIALNVYAIPSVIALQDGNRNSIKNGSHIGPMREGQDLQVVCEVYGARPAPVISWHRSGGVVRDTQTSENHDGLFTVKSTLSLTLSRQELGATYNCRVEMKELLLVVDNNFHIDLQVRPTKINLSGVKHHTVQGTKVLLQCQVSGARPAANMTWYNSSKLISDETNEITSTSTKTYLQNDGTFETISQMIFTATRFENGASMRCEADNIVMREDGDRPLHDTLTLEVMYPPVVSVKPDNITVNETHDFLVFCDYEANPASLESVKWFRNGQEIKLNNVRHEGGTPEQTALLIRNSSRTDNGAYTCELSNSIGSDVSDNEIYVDVLYKPIVVLNMEPDTPVIENDQANITLLCNIIDGNPLILTKVRWFLDGEFLKELPECDDDSQGDENLCEVDPTKMLLQNVGREFIGNYSCEGFNVAGWGDNSEENPLDIYYEPGNASMTHYPYIAIKRRSVTFNCSIEDRGNPVATRYRWLRGGKPVMDVVTPSWTVDPVGLDSRTTFSCFAYNEGGEGNAAEVHLEVHAPPAFVQKLHPYVGALYSTSNISLACRVECVPSCTISWFKDGVGIEENDERYYITNTYMPAEPATGDFESAYSVLHFNMSAWPDGILDRIRDSSNYSCVSSNNSAGPGVRSTTYFGVEYPPENTSLSTPLISVEEGKIPPRIVCSSRAYPEPAFFWTRNGETIAKGSSLIVNHVMERDDAGVYTCNAFNRHGNHSTDAVIDIHYKPTCTIVRQEVNDEDVLICTANGSPKESEFEWSLKYENDTLQNHKTRGDAYESTLVLDSDVSAMRTYVCVASNSVGVGTPCEIEVAGYVAWWLKGDILTPYILIAAVAALLLAVILICVIIICICRRKRRQNKSSIHIEEIEDAEFAFMKNQRSPKVEPDASENIQQYDKTVRWRIRRFFEKRNSIDLLKLSTQNVITYVKKPQVASTPTTKEPQQTGDDRNENVPSTSADVVVTGESSTAGGSQIEPGEYENLPFHGLQTPPKKPILAKNLAPAVKCPNKSITPSCFPTHPYNYISYQQRDINSTNKQSNSGLSSYNTSQSTMLTNQSNMSSLSNSQESSGNTNSYLSKTAERRKAPQMLDNSDALSTHSFSSGKLKRPPGPIGSSGENKKLIDLETVTPLYENLTDSIQIHESPIGNGGNGGIGAKFAIDDGQERYRISLRKPRRANSRSNSAVSNSYYDCIKPIPAPRHRKYASTNSLLSKNIQMYSNRLDPIYMNLPVSSGYETDPRANEERNSGSECPSAYDNQYFEITQHQTRILIPKELFPVDRSNQAKINQLLKKNLISSNRRHIKLPLQKHHSFNFQSSQTVEATVRDLKIKSHSISSKTLRDYRSGGSNTNTINNNSGSIINSNVNSSSTNSSNNINNNNNNNNNNSNSSSSSNFISSNSNNGKFPISSTNPFHSNSNSLTGGSSSRRSFAAARQQTTQATATLATVRQHHGHSQSEDESSSDQESNYRKQQLQQQQQQQHQHHHHQQQQLKQHSSNLVGGPMTMNSATTATVYKYETNSIAFKPITPVPTSTPAITNSKSSVNNMCKDKFAIK
ncbi:hemicentin-1 isoform X2 [Toxorhynchites rutilus septentrionalis]|uniref:hemicentin-1 isoform X2 n=1 Tax=Toxorhynchites rutilus septentrionalis TaxID=329112 RepID=UPI0024784FF5|nr:hemicentin-1 isoform X2 [Toxorhynchites rutilus septentrionalis]